MGAKTGNGNSTDTLKQKLAQHLDSTRAKLDALKEELSEIHQEDAQALQQRRDQLQARMDQRREQLQKLQANISSWQKEKATQTRELIGTLRQKHEIAKLEARAERAEGYALDLVSVAAFDFEEAEQALLDAVAARLDANQAASAAT